MSLRLYLGTPSSCSLASHLALEESGLAYEAVRLDFAKAEQRGAEYLKINPKGRVPALVTDRGILTETPAILVFIAQSAPAMRLAPLDDPFTFAGFQAFNAYLCSTVHVAFAHLWRGARWSDDPAVVEAMKLKVPRNVSDCFTIIETEYLTGPWVMGEDFSVADPYLFTFSSWLEGVGVDIKRFPKVADHFARMKARPAVARVLAGV